MTTSPDVPENCELFKSPLMFLLLDKVASKMP